MYLSIHQLTPLLCKSLLSASLLVPAYLLVVATSTFSPFVAFLGVTTSAFCVFSIVMDTVRYRSVFRLAHRLENPNAFAATDLFCDMTLTSKA